MVGNIHVYTHPELRQLAALAADKEGIPMSDYVARVLAMHFQRPDLAAVPRKKMGRPRKELAAP